MEDFLVYDDTLQKNLLIIKTKSLRTATEYITKLRTTESGKMSRDKIK